MRGKPGRPRARPRKAVASHDPEATPLPPLGQVDGDRWAALYDLPGFVPVLLVLALSIATIAIVATSGGSDPAESSPPAAGLPSGLLVPPTESPSSAPEPFASERPAPTGDTAGSSGLALSFDMLPTGAAITDWVITGDGTFEVTAVPTAVNRSARLAAGSRAIACLPLDAMLGTLTAAFMVDAAPSGEQQLLAVNLADGTILALRSSANGMVGVDSADAVSLEPGAWYRLRVSAAAEHVEVRLLNAADDVLTGARVPADGGRAIGFCITSIAPMRVYLDQFIVEA